MGPTSCRFPHQWLFVPRWYEFRLFSRHSCVICVEPYRPFSSPLVEIFHFRETWQALTSNLVSAGSECPTGFTQVLFGMFPVCLMRGAHPLKEVGDHLSTGASVLFLQTATTVKVIVHSQSRQLEFGTLQKPVKGSLIFLLTHLVSPEIHYLIRIR